MLDLSAVAASGVIHWQDLGLQPGIDLGFFTLRYYSLAYLFGLFAAYGHLRKMIAAPVAPLALRHADDLLFYCMMGVIFGGRLGYAIFYKPELFTGFSGDGFVTWELLRLWDGGMSFHGGLVGVLTAIAWVSRRGDLSFIRVCDYIAVNVGFGMLFGRLANFVNGELWGRPVQSDVAWAMIFPGAGPEPRHPSQLYEAGLEGLLVICVMLPLFWLTRARYRPGLLVGVFTAMIASARFVVEFFRQPDAHLNEFAESTGLSMGQWLTIPLILAGLGVVVWALMRPSLASPKKPAEA